MFDRRRIAAKLRALWNRNPWGKVVVIAGVASTGLAISGTLLSLLHTTTSEFDGCIGDRETMKKRASAMLQSLQAEHGQAKPSAGDSDRLVFAQSQFDIMYRTKLDPCDSYFEVRVPIASSPRSSLPPDRMLEVLEDRNIGGNFERGTGSSFVYDDEVKTYYLSFAVPLKELRNGAVEPAVAERRSLGEAWRGGWFDQVSRIAVGQAPIPKEIVYRPGKNPNKPSF